MPSTVTCERCGAVVERKSPQQRFCCDKCRYLWSYYQRDRLSPEFRAANNERCKRWYEAHKAEHIAKVAARKRAANVSELSPSKRKGEEPDSWMLPAPELDYLPGGAFTLDLRPRHKFPHHQLSALHGIVTAITGPHHPTKPQFALVPWPCGCGWAVYVEDIETARMVAGKMHAVRFDGNATLHCGPLMRIKAPSVATGLHRLRIDALTPVHVRSSGGTVLRLVPTSSNLRGTLEGFLPRRLGVSVPPGSVALRVLEDCTRTDRVDMRGNGAKLNGCPGWVGHVIIETNAVGRWLFECAALGLGYGGKVAFGFGRIRVTDLRKDSNAHRAA